MAKSQRKQEQNKASDGETDRDGIASQKLVVVGRGKNNIRHKEKRRERNERAPEAPSFTQRARDGANRTPSKDISQQRTL